MADDALAILNALAHELFSETQGNPFLVFSLILALRGDRAPSASRFGPSRDRCDNPNQGATGAICF